MTPDRPFLRLLEELRDGDVVSELEAGWATLRELVRTQKQKGKLTLTLVVEPAGEGLVVIDVVALQLPTGRHSGQISSAPAPAPHHALRPRGPDAAAGVRGSGARARPGRRGPRRR